MVDLVNGTGAVAGGAVGGYLGYSILAGQDPTVRYIATGIGIVVGAMLGYTVAEYGRGVVGV